MHDTEDKDSQGDCNYYTPDIIKTGNFQIIMENKDVTLYSILLHRQEVHRIHIYANFLKLQWLMLLLLFQRTEWGNKLLANEGFIDS